MCLLVNIGNRSCVVLFRLHAPYFIKINNKQEFALKKMLLHSVLNNFPTCPQSQDVNSNAKLLLSFSSSAYQNNDITEFEKILKTNHSNIMDDPFIREHIEGE